MNDALIEDNSGTTAVREGFALPVDRLTAWMGANIEGFEGPVRIEQFKGGQSNPTYKLVTPARAYVLRRKPPGLLLKGAHAVEREAAAMQGLGLVGFPVPRVHGICHDDDVIGSAFFVMDMVDGRIFWDATFPEVERDDRPAYFDAMNRTIANLHRVDVAAAGLADFGKQGNYFERQIGRFSGQYRADEEAGRIPEMDRLAGWLAANIPAGDNSGIVHGDFRCDNMIFHPTRPEVIAVLDWELSTLGHPLADFAYHAMMYRMPPDIVAGLDGADLSLLNIPREEDYLSSYCRRVGRDGVENWNFYIAFNLFRLAAIFHGIKGRVVRGTAASAKARARAEALPRLVNLAVEAMEQCK